MEIEIAMDRQLVAQHALIIYGYEKDPRYEEPANSIDHYITKHRVDGEGRLLEGAPLTREMLHKICSLVIPSLQTMEYIPEKVLAYSPGTAILWWTPGVREARLLYERNRVEIGRLSAAGDVVPCRQPDAPHVGPRHNSEARARHPHLSQPLLQRLRRRDVLHGEHRASPERVAGRHQRVGKGFLRRRLQRPHRAEAARDRPLRAMEGHRGKDRIPQRVSRPLRHRGGRHQVSGGKEGAMDTNLKDRLIQERFPTIMAPRYEDLSPCPLHQTRLLMARGGLYIDTLQPFGAFRRCLWFADRDLPYGEVEEVDEFSGILKDPQVTAIFENCILPQAAEYADDNREWAGWIVWTKEEGYSYLPLDFEASAASVFIRQRPVLPEDTHLVIDVHSHGTMKAFFSSTDDVDDSGGVRLSVVLGSYSRNEGRHNFLYKCRAVVEGFFFDLEVDP